MSKYCLNCGRELPDYARFCDACGRELSSSDDESQRTRNGSSQLTDPDLERDFMSVYAQTQSRPDDSDDEAFDWMLERIRELSARGLSRERIFQLELNLLHNLRDLCILRFDSYIAVSSGPEAIMRVCGELLERGDVEGAEALACPYIKRILNNRALFLDGRLCFQDEVEEAEYLLERDLLEVSSLEEARIRYTRENYTALLLLYSDILVQVAFRKKRMNARVSEIRRECLYAAADISPCNAMVWASLAQLADQEKDSAYQMCIWKALKYCSSHSTLGKIYANLALHYSADNAQLSVALSEASKSLGQDVLAARFLLSNSQERTYATDHAQVLRAHGIPTDLSDFARRAIAIAATHGKKAS